MHTSILTGRLWLHELLKGHPLHFHEQIGMSQHVFSQLSQELQLYSSLKNSWHVTADEQLAIFVHLAWTGQSSWMLQERFQCSGDTISKYIFHWYLTCLNLKCDLHLLQLCSQDNKNAHWEFLSEACTSIASWANPKWNPQEPKIISIHISNTVVVPWMVLIFMHMPRLRQLPITTIAKAESHKMCLLPLILISNLPTCLVAERAVQLNPRSLNILAVRTLLSPWIATTSLMLNFLFVMPSWHHITESATISKSGLVEIRSMCLQFLFLWISNGEWSFLDHKTIKGYSISVMHKLEMLLSASLGYSSTGLHSWRLLQNTLLRHKQGLSLLLQEFIILFAFVILQTRHFNDGGGKNHPPGQMTPQPLLKYFMLDCFAD